jgi:hypothetical protein
MAKINSERYFRPCESPTCPRRRRLWRALFVPLRGLSLDDHWYCSPECFRYALTSTIEQLLPGPPPPQNKPHRVPLGLLMLSRGYVDEEQLKRALQAQRDSGTGRLGEWLRHLGAVTEEQVTQILGFQWSIPIFPLNKSRQYLECSHLVPLPLLEVAEMVPVHYIPSSHHLYVAFVDRINYTALYSVEKMLECHTEPCLALQSQVQQALEDLHGRPRPSETLIDTVCDPLEIADATLFSASKLSAQGVRVSGFGGYIWTRILSPTGLTNVLFRIRKALLTPPREFASPDRSPGIPTGF